MSKLSHSDYDPLFLNARREAGIVLRAWFGFFLWVIGYSALIGYAPPDPAEPAPLIFGIPSWVFWGVALPWVLANLFTFWFAFRGMTDDPLTAVDGEDIPADGRAGNSDAEVTHG